MTQDPLNDTAIEELWLARLMEKSRTCSVVEVSPRVRKSTLSSQREFYPDDVLQLLRRRIWTNLRFEVHA